MMKPVVFKVQLFRGPGDRERSQVALLSMLQALSEVNVGHLKQKRYPELYTSGVRYVREEGSEEWRDIPTIIEAGAGDCEDLACWRIAELRVQGQHAFPFITFRRVGGVYHYHALVERFRSYDRRTGRFSGGFLEDPSRSLGMGRPEGVSQRRATGRAA